MITKCNKLGYDAPSGDVVGSIHPSPIWHYLALYGLHKTTPDFILSKSPLSQGESVETVPAVAPIESIPLAGEGTEVTLEYIILETIATAKGQ